MGVRDPISITKTSVAPTLVLFLGIVWLVAEVYWQGLSARWFYRMFEFRDGTPLGVMLVLSILSTCLVQLVPSVVIAWIVSLVRPRRWLLYSCLMVAPQIISTLVMTVRDGLTPYEHGWLMMESVFAVVVFLLWIQPPVLLMLIYRIYDIWGRASHQSGSENPRQQHA